jgi:hypothetical protein
MKDVKKKSIYVHEERTLSSRHDDDDDDDHATDAETLSAPTLRRGKSQNIIKYHHPHPPHPHPHQQRHQQQQQHHDAYIANRFDISIIMVDNFGQKYIYVQKNFGLVYTEIYFFCQSLNFVFFLCRQAAPEKPCRSSAAQGGLSPSS